MAKGNDGNLLQHGIELAAVSAIDRLPTFLTCTHSMAPRERCDDPKRDRRLRYWLNAATNTPSVARAYRETSASLESYPNTSELIASLIGDENLRGDLFEVCDDKIDELRTRWNRYPVAVHGQSWRIGLGETTIPSTEDGWLFTMDPMTFVSDNPNAEDDNNLRPQDVDLLIQFFHRIANFGARWVISIFCFELRRGPGVNRYQLFLDEMERFRHALGLHKEMHEVSYGDPHVGFVFSSSSELLGQIREQWQTLDNV